MRVALALLLVACSSPAREARPTTTASSPPPPAPDAAIATCDEVSCVLDGYEGACCEQFRGTPGPTPPDPSVIEHRGRDEIQAGVAQIKPAVRDCANQHPSSTGIVKLAVTVSPEGRVTDVEVRESPDPAIGACAANAMRGARFVEAQHESVFVYPFNF